MDQCWIHTKVHAELVGKNVMVDEQVAGAPVERPQERRLHRAWKLPLVRTDIMDAGQNWADAPQRAHLRPVRLVDEHVQVRDVEPTPDQAAAGPDYDGRSRLGRRHRATNQSGTQHCRIGEVADDLVLRHRREPLAVQ